MNNLVYLIVRYLESENIEATKIFNSFDGTDNIVWFVGDWTRYDLTIYENAIRLSVYHNSKLSSSDEIKTFADFRRLI